MSVKELAEEIVLASRQDRYSKALAFKGFLESLLSSALDEAFNKWKSEDGQIALVNIGYKGGQKDSYEECVKIAEEVKAKEMKPFEYTSGHKAGLALMIDLVCQQIAAKIRQKAEEVGKV